MPGFKGAMSEISEAVVQPAAGQIKQAVTEGLEDVFKGPQNHQQNQQNPQAAAQQQVQDANRQRDEAQKRTHIVQFLEKVKQGEQTFNQQRILRSQKEQQRTQNDAEIMQSKVRQFDVSPKKGMSAALSNEKFKTERGKKMAA
jgi:hypothetical protein